MTAMLCRVDHSHPSLQTLEAALMLDVSLHSLSPTSFENLCFDIVRGMAFQNPTWRTPGADGGRDIEAWRAIIDPTFVSTQEKWFIECKRYATAVDWPTIHDKIAHAEALDADYLFIMTTSSASPTSLDRINSWNSLNRRPRVRFWGEHDVLSHISIRRELCLKYGFGSSSAETLGFAEVSLEMAKIISTIHSGTLYSRDVNSALEYANALARCWTERVSQVQNRGAFFSFPKNIATEDFNLSFSTWGEHRDLGRGELLTILWTAFVTENKSLHVGLSGSQISIRLTKTEIELALNTRSSKVITFIAGSELSKKEDDLIIQEMQYV